MRLVVQEAWLRYTEPLEGGVPYPYADKLQLITTAYGNLIDPVSTAMTLPWQIDGRAARGDEIAAQWYRVKNDPKCAPLGHLYAKTLTTMRLTPEGMAMVAHRKLLANDDALTSRFPEFQDWPACAIMATHSLAWACGASFHFPKLAAALLARDFEAAAVHCTINEWNGSVHNVGVIPRNVANRILFLNAARVVAFKLDPDYLNWTSILAVADLPTSPGLEDPPSDPIPLVNTDIIDREPLATVPTLHVAPSVYLGNEEPDPEAA